MYPCYYKYRSTPKIYHNSIIHKTIIKFEHKFSTVSTINDIKFEHLQKIKYLITQIIEDERQRTTWDKQKLHFIS